MKLLLMISLVVAILVYPAQAADPIFEQQFDIYGGKKVLDSIPNSIRDSLRIQRFNLSPDDVMRLLEPDKIYDEVKKSLNMPLKNAIRFFGLIMLVVFATALFQTLKSSFGGGNLDTILNITAICCISVIVFGATKDNLAACFDAVKELTAFNNVLMPAITGVFAATGRMASAAAVQGSALLVSTIVSNFNAGLFVPLVEAYLALCLAGALSGGLKLTAVAKTIKDITSWGLLIGVTVISGMIALKGVLAGAADNAAVKTVNFTVSNFVPIVGSTLSEVVKAVMSCSGLVKTTLGTLGVLVTVLTVAEPFLTLLLNMAVLKLSSTVAEMLGHDKINAYLADVASIQSIILAILLSVTVLFLLSTAIAISMGVG